MVEGSRAWRALLAAYCSTIYLFLFILALSPYSSLTFHHYIYAPPPIHPPPHPSLSLSSTPYDREVREHTCTHASAPWLFLRILSQNPSRFSPFSFSFPLSTTSIFFLLSLVTPLPSSPLLSLLSLFLTHLSVAPC